MTKVQITGKIKEANTDNNWKEIRYANTAVDDRTKQKSPK